MPKPGRKTFVFIGAVVVLMAGAAWWFNRGPSVVRPDDWGSLDPAVANEVRWVSRLATLNPGSAATRRRLAMVYDANGLREPALETYQQACELDPKDARSWYLLANELSVAGRQSDAFAAIENAIALDSSVAWLHWRKGFWLLSEQKLEEAEAALAKALQLDPQSTMAMIGLARVRLQQQRFDDAEKLLRRIPATDSNYGYSCTLRSLAFAGLGQMEDSRVEASRGARSRPIQTDPWQLEVMIHRRSFLLLMEEARNRIDAGKPEMAIPILESLSPRQPNDANLINNMAAALLATEQLDRAEQFLAQAADRLPLDDQIPMNIGVIQYKRGNIATAIEHTRRAIDLNPNAGKAHLHLGVMLREQGNVVAAVASLERALELGHDPLSCRLELGQTLLKAGRVVDAEKIFAQAALQSPHSSEAFAWHARALAELGHTDRAWTQVRTAGRLHPRAANIGEVIARLRQLGPEPPESEVK